MNDNIESETQSPVLNAPRVTLADIRAEIISEHYFTALDGVSWADPSHNDTDKDAEESLGLMTFCVLMLRNGCKVVGINYGPVNPADFSPEYGRHDARADAIRKVWPLLGFRLRDKLAGITDDFNAHDIADAHRDSFAAGQSASAA